MWPASRSCRWSIARRAIEMKAAASILGAALALAPMAAQPQAFPSKPLRMYTQFGPGAPGDVFARIYAAALTNVMGQPVIVDSRPGGGGMLAAGVMVRAEPDGYTLAMLTAT